jgi:predicted DNA-binding transcriptional regulator YafY
VIKRAIANGTTLEIVYLKPNDEKSRRVIKPGMIGEMEYRGKSYLGMRTFYLKRNEERVFRVDRILEAGQA